jgi:hypothetical protein
MIQMDNKRNGGQSFMIRDLVYLLIQPYKQKSIAHIASYKLAFKYFGLYQVI